MDAVDLARARGAGGHRHRQPDVAGGAGGPAATTVPLPTPEGPDRTVSAGTSGARAQAVGGRAELRLERLALLDAEPADAPARGDLQRLHDPLRLDLADAGHRLQHGADLHLADGLVALAVGEELGQRGADALELRLELGPGLAGLGGLRERGGALLGRQGRQGHGVHLAVAAPDVGPARARAGAVPRGQGGGTGVRTGRGARRTEGNLADSRTSGATDPPGGAGQVSPGAGAGPARARPRRPPGSAAPVTAGRRRAGRPRRRRACPGWPRGPGRRVSAPAGRTPGVMQRHAAVRPRPDGRDLRRGADQRPRARVDGERRQPADGVERRPDRPRSAARSASSSDVSTVTAAIAVASGAASTAARTMVGPPAACTVRKRGRSRATARAAPATVLPGCRAA